MVVTGSMESKRRPPLRVELCINWSVVQEWTVFFCGKLQCFFARSTFPALGRSVGGGVTCGFTRPVNPTSVILKSASFSLGGRDLARAFPDPLASLIFSYHGFKKKH